VGKYFVHTCTGIGLGVLLRLVSNRIGECHSGFLMLAAPGGTWVGINAHKRSIVTEEGKEKIPATKKVAQVFYLAWQVAVNRSVEGLVFCHAVYCFCGSHCRHLMRIVNKKRWGRIANQ